ncbi:major histocompatibility complex class I-related gene protein-like isoform X2 [Trachinotus anak]|uniref:major histocompatibility complex class I-related gene protein-like isoform X2 n=1 Tax=Trachinotus anak TaxID=443729 RepID=UPI0039F1E328
MKKLFLLLLLCHVSSAVKHTLVYFTTASTGVPNFPEGVAVTMIDGLQAGYCDTNTLELQHDWVKKLLNDNPDQLQWYTEECLEDVPTFFKASIHSLKQRFNQSGGVHILQRMSGCEWDDETGEVVGFNQYGYDGEDFLSFDLKTLTWIAPKPQALITKHSWDADKPRSRGNKYFFTQICPEWLKKTLTYGRSSLLRTDLPSVSLLQKSPSSPVSCHATGFYPDRALMLWRKDGEDLHEDVDQGEILPNHDGSFQMRVDLDLSSVKPEDWRRYECVFLLSGVKEEIITKLDKAVIRSNWGKNGNGKEKPSDITVSIIAAVVVLTLILIAVTGFMVYRKKKAKHPPSPPENVSELHEELNPET